MSASNRGAKRASETAIDGLDREPEIRVGSAYQLAAS